jgi:hypothetical protein
MPAPEKTAVLSAGRMPRNATAASGPSVGPPRRTRQFQPVQQPGNPVGRHRLLPGKLLPDPMDQHHPRHTSLPSTISSETTTSRAAHAPAGHPIPVNSRLATGYRTVKIWGVP